MTNIKIIDCTTCKYGYEDERLGIPLCHHPKRFSEDCVNFNMHEEKETEESEKPINLDDAMKELDEKIALVKQRGTWKGVDVDKYMDEVKGREPEKPMNLEEEIKRTYHDGSVADTSNIDHVTYENIARHFAQWGYLRAAEKYNEIEYNRQRAEEPVSDDLEEAVEKQIDEALFKWSYDDEDGIEQYVHDAFIAGAKWQAEQDEKEQADLFTIVALDAAQRTKEQMMKEAVEGEITKDNRGNNVVRAGVFNKDFEYGQKVRVIVLPKED